MASNILSIPFRRSHSVSLSEALKQYISKKYDQHPDMFAQDLQDIDKLRSDAVTSLEPHVSGIKKMASYAAQLVWVGGKFPIDIGVEFVWYPALGFNTQRPVSESNLRFELANVLFNLAALYSQLALSLNRSTSEGLKAANSYFCQAAGVIDYLKTEIIPDMRTAPPEDMDNMTLECLHALMLAQAQECSWSMAIKNGYKDALISKLAAKLSDFYDLAAENGTRSDTISTEWIHHMSAKHHHFAAAAQYRAACDCLERRKYGEEVARLRDSATCVTEALKESKWINKIVLGDLNGLKMRVTEDLKRAEKDNDVIYLMPVPPKSELKALDRAAMAVAKKPTDILDPSSSLGDGKPFGQPLFARLVPYSVHVAASIYADRRDRIINSSIIDELEDLTNNIRDLLQSLNLPGSLQALEKPLGVPASVTSRAEEIRQQGGIHMLRRAMRDVESLKDNDVATFGEGTSFLQTEASEEDRARTKHGTERWTRPSSQIAGQTLYSKAGEIEGYLNAAAGSDELVKTKLKDTESALAVLEGTDRDLENYIPNSRKKTMAPKLEQEASRLRTILNEIGRLEGRRRRKAEALREKGKSDDINPVLLTEAARLERELPLQKIEAAQFEDLFEKRLQRYDDDRIMVADEREDQEHLASQLQEANSAFVAAKKGENTNREREQALQRLEAAYLKYKEILSNIESARDFYNNLAKIVNSFREECQQFRYQRRMEAGQLESDLSNAMSALSLAQTSSLQDQKERENLRSQFNQNLNLNHHTANPSNRGPSSSANVAPLAPMNANTNTNSNYHSGQSQVQAQSQPQPRFAAPMPTRATAAAPVVPGFPNQGQGQAQPGFQSPGAGPGAAVWSPERGIKFGGSAGIPVPPVGVGLGGGGVNVHNPAYPNTRSAAGGAGGAGRGQWNPDMGLRFN